MSRAALDHLPAIQATPSFPREVPWALADAKMRLGPIFRIDGLSERPVVCMIGAEAGRFISHTHKDCFSHELGWTPIVDTFLGRSLFCMDGAEHTRYRKMLTPPFTNAAVERYMPIIMRVVRARTHDWADRGIVNVHEEIRRIVFGIAVETLIGGCSEADIDRLTRAFRTVTEGALALDRDAGSAHMPEKMRAYDELTDILRNVVRKRRAIDSGLPGDPTDLMHIAVNAQDHRGRRLTDDQVLRHLRNVLA
ncbi:MAG TPA: cytochrome P450, partial [Ktedonobacterales bacterium]|nr:cytochrome P450 [Ktedonobacterales bacterium]